MDVQSRNQLQASILDLFTISIAKQVAGAERTVCEIKAKRDKWKSIFFTFVFRGVNFLRFSLWKNSCHSPSGSQTPKTWRWLWPWVHWTSITHLSAFVSIKLTNMPVTSTTCTLYIIFMTINVLKRCTVLGWKGNETYLEKTRNLFTQ